VKGHRLHVRRKLKENNGKMKKIEASSIKRLPRINTQIFVSSVLELSPFSLSHTLGNLEFSWRTLGGVWHTWRFGERRQIKSMKA